jgi:putative endonuclease
MRDGEALVFVEVRRRRTVAGRFASAAETVGPRKQARLLRSARCYIAGLRRVPPCRFDVVAIDEDGRGETRLDWIRDAFHG